MFLQTIRRNEGGKKGVKVADSSFFSKQARNFVLLYAFHPNSQWLDSQERENTSSVKPSHQKTLEAVQSFWAECMHAHLGVQI